MISLGFITISIPNELIMGTKTGSAVRTIVFFAPSRFANNEDRMLSCSFSDKATKKSAISIDASFRRSISRALPWRTMVLSSTVAACCVFSLSGSIIVTPIFCSSNFFASSRLARFTP